MPLRPADGVAGLTGKDEDRVLFKATTWRNVEFTYSHFHDGKASTLAEAVAMDKLQLGKSFTEHETQKIVALLNTLTGDQPTLALPNAPPASDTPRLPLLSRTSVSRIVSDADFAPLESREREVKRTARQALA